MFGKRNASDLPQAKRPASAVPMPVAAPNGSKDPIRAAGPASPAAAQGAQSSAAKMSAKSGDSAGHAKVVAEAAKPKAPDRRHSEEYYDVKTTVFNALIDTIDLTQLAKLDADAAREEIRNIVGEIEVIKRSVAGHRSSVSKMLRHFERRLTLQLVYHDFGELFHRPGGAAAAGRRARPQWR